MFIGHYKCVNSPEEFFSKQRDTLDFPAQVEINKKRYTLTRTYHVASKSKLKRLTEMAEKNSIPFDVEIK